MRVLALLVVFFAASAGSSSAWATELTKYHVSDKLSQSSLVFDSSGNLVGQERLRSFGEVDVSNRASEEWRHSYHGKQRHASHGLIDFGARFYDPELGRFLTIDPRGFRESSPDSFNRYAFANNNPYRYTDPDGRVVETAWDFANLGIGAHSLANNIASKNWGAAAVDTVGLGLDALAAAVPFVPGGASAAIKAERASRSAASTSARTRAAASVENVTKKTTESGIGVTRHSVQQKINRQVRSADELDAIKNPLDVRPVKVDKLGRPSQRSIGRKAEVARNPETGDIVSVNPTSTKKAERLLRRQGGQ